MRLEFRYNVKNDELDIRAYRVQLAYRRFGLADRFNFQPITQAQLLHKY